MTKTKWAKACGSAQAKEETKRGVTHARKGAEDLRSAAGAMDMKIGKRERSIG